VSGGAQVPPLAVNTAKKQPADRDSVAESLILQSGAGLDNSRIFTVNSEITAS
jgi:hypothetical protein